VPEKPTPPPVPAIGACPAVSNAAPARVVARAAGDAVPVLPATGGASQIVAGFFAMLMGSGTWRLTKRARQR
jgi:LPXTG-motif cell wall-anchored protein